MKHESTKITYTCDVCGKPCGNYDGCINETLGYIGQGEFPVTVYAKLRMRASYVTESGDVCMDCALKALKAAVKELEKTKAMAESMGGIFTLPSN